MINHWSLIINDFMTEHSVKKKVVQVNIVVMFNHRCNSLWFFKNVTINIFLMFGDKVGVVTYVHIIAHRFIKSCLDGVYKYLLKGVVGGMILIF